MSKTCHLLAIKICYGGNLFHVAPFPPTDVTAVQDGVTSIRVTWTPSSGATGYRIDYSGGGSSDSVDVSGGDTNSYSLTGLTNGETYSISIVATSDHFFSDSVSTDMSVNLGEQSVKTGFLGIISLFAVPGKPEIATMTVSTAITISLSWSVPSSSVVTEYLIEWQRDTSVGCSDEDQNSTTITDGSTSYTISGLEEDSRYTITVTASNTAGSSEVSNSVTAVTEEAGERLSLLVVLVYGPLSHSSICPSLFCDCD